MKMRNASSRRMKMRNASSQRTKMRNLGLEGLVPTFRTSLYSKIGSVYVLFSLAPFSHWVFWGRVFNETYVNQTFCLETTYQVAAQFLFDICSPYCATRP